MAGRWLVATCVLWLTSCEEKTPAPVGLAPVGHAGGHKDKASEHPPAAAHQHGRDEPMEVCEARGKEPLQAARDYYDGGRYEDALSCAAQAAALNPQDTNAHSERGAALAALQRHDEAQLAYARALAIDPDHLDALLGAAHLYGVSMPSNRERDELAVLYSERGLERAQARKEPELAVQFALLSAMAFNDLGQARDALNRADRVLKREPKNTEALYERAVALFELSRFREAKPAFLSMLDGSRRSAHAHHHLGLLFEREGKWKLAEQHFAQAQALNPEDFPAPQLLTKEEFAAEVRRAVEQLPDDMRGDLEGIPVTAADLPEESDLLSGEPPLSPAILGLYRGPPLGESCDPRPLGLDPKAPCRSVVLYRRNLARAVHSRAELLEQIRVTLLHEVGHLRGEDDFELAARGLE